MKQRVLIGDLLRDFDMLETLVILLGFNHTDEFFNDIG